MRIVFQKGYQKKFMKEVCGRLKTSLRGLRKYKIHYGYSAMKKYYREELTLPKDLAETLTEISNVDWIKFKPTGELLDTWGKSKGGTIGKKKMEEKYKNKLSEWGRKGYEAKLSELKPSKPIIKPKMNGKLAELVGIILGDGTISKYFLRVSLNAKKEKNYASYVSKLGKDLFGIEGVIRKEKNQNVLNVKFYSVNLVKFLTEELGLPIGDKIRNKAKIPERIFLNKTLMLSCLRGLVDTDGSLGNRAYFYNSNPVLIEQVARFTRKYNIFTAFYYNAVGTANKLKVKEYLNLIGTSKTGS